MLKRIFCSVAAAIAFTVAQAQVTDIAFAAVRYTFVYLSDTTLPAETDNMILYLGKQASVYKSYDKMLRDSAMQEQIAAMKKSGMVDANGNMTGSTPLTITVPRMKPGSPTSIYREGGAATLQRVEFLIKNYLIEEDIPVIDWSVSEETKTIQGLTCQKATTTFRGRKYTAWFCSQMPYNAGPWKLNGLPGLIIEAADERKQVQFQFAGYEDVSHKNIAIALPAGTIKATDKEFRQLHESAMNDPMGFMRSALSGGGGLTTSVASGARGSAPSSNPNAKRRVNNNPIEKN